MDGFPLKELIERYPKTIATIVGAVVLFGIALLVMMWWLWGWGPRRRRAMAAARKALQAGDWQQALEQLKKVRAIGVPSSFWNSTFDEFEADCLKAGSANLIEEKKFEEGLNLGLQAAKLHEEPGNELRANVQAAMVREIRRLFSKHGETKATSDLIARTLQVQSPCREASFWQALCDLRNGQYDQALTNLQISRTGMMQGVTLDTGFGESGAGPPTPFIDPALYLGALLVRKGQAKEALRFLTEANRQDANCPFITLQLGAAIVTAGGDTNMAVRALQRALGPKGLGMWLDNPQKAWVEGFPDNRSYVRKLASELPFSCPLFGDDLKFLIRQGNLSLALGLFKLENYKEAAEQFDRVLKEGAPSLQVLRGLGLSLAKLGRFDDAFVHLRTAHELEEAKDRLTVGYLALCGAAGKPARPEDKIQNIAWAIRLVTAFNSPRDPEWVGILNRIFTEARQHQIPLTGDDQLYLCEHLVSVKACDKLSAQAFHHLLATERALVLPEYAWLYCQADTHHDVGGEHALALYQRTFANRAAASDYFAKQGWSLDEVERMYLRRAAELAPGRFPEVLGEDYLPRGEALLLATAQAQEDAGQREAALATIEVLVKLSPNNTSAMNRAAGLHYRAGRLPPALALLEQWRAAQPSEPTPIVRQALLHHQQGDTVACNQKLMQAMALASGRRRANIAFVGARTSLQIYLASPASADADAGPNHLGVAIAFLGECLASDATHPHAHWCLAAVRWLQGDTAALAQQASAMSDANVADQRYHFLAALAHLLAGDKEAAIAASKRTGAGGRDLTGDKKVLAVEAGYISALAHLDLGQSAAAIDALKPITYNPSSPTLSHAQALLGNVLFQMARHDDAINVWQVLDAGKRKAWNLDEPLAQTTFINALESLACGQYEQGAEKLRLSGRLGCRDRRLGPLLLLALFKAGQQAIYAGETAPVTGITEPSEKSK